MLNCWDAPHHAMLQGDCVKPPSVVVILVAFLVVAGGIVRRRSCCGCEHSVLTLSVVDCLVPFLCVCHCSLPGGNVVFPYPSLSF